MLTFYVLRKLLFRVKRKALRLISKNVQQTYLGDRIGEYSLIWTKIAHRLSAKIEAIDKDIWIISKDGKTVPVRLHQLPLDNDVVLKICGRKPLVHKILKNASIPIPSHCAFNIQEYHLAKSFLLQHPNGVVVKPADGYSGLGVTTHIFDDKQLQRAIILASLYSTNLMIEEQIVGENYRFLIFRGKILHVVKRKGQFVVGNGQSKIGTLLGSDVLDPDLKFTLNAQGMSIRSIPNKNKIVLVRSHGKHYDNRTELRTIYDTEVVDLVHQSIKDFACKSTKLVGAELVGVDIITTDITQPLETTKGVINELNTTPALHHHYDKTKQEFPPPAFTIVKQLLGN